MSRTAYKKLTKLYWPLRKRSLKQLYVHVEPKKLECTTKKFWRFTQTCAPLSNSRRCSGTCPWIFHPSPAFREQPGNQPAFPLQVLQFRRRRLRLQTLYHFVVTRWIATYQRRNRITRATTSTVSDTASIRGVSSAVKNSFSVHLSDDLVLRTHHHDCQKFIVRLQRTKNAGALKISRSWNLRVNTTN